MKLVASKVDLMVVKKAQMVVKMVVKTVTSLVVMWVVKMVAVKAPRNMGK